MRENRVCDKFCMRWLPDWPKTLVFAGVELRNVIKISWNGAKLWENFAFFRLTLAGPGRRTLGIGAGAFERFRRLRFLWSVLRDCPGWFCRGLTVCAFLVCGDCGLVRVSWSFAL